MRAALITSLCSITFCQVGVGFQTGNLPVITLAHSASPRQGEDQQLLRGGGRIQEVFCLEQVLLQKESHKTQAEALSI